MKTLILSDLHYNKDNPISRKKLDKILGIEREFDAILLGGDNADLSKELRNHQILFEKLMERFSCPAGFILGNHDLWGKILDISSFKLLYDIFPKLGEAHGFTYLEESNLEVSDISYVGTYGHFDYSFLKKGGEVSIDDLLRGEFRVKNKKITWNDRIYMNWEGKTDESVCEKLIKKFGERMKEAERPISISHTIPNQTLNGWPDSPEQCFMEPYSGSKLLEDVLKANGGEYHFCGHTHIRAKDTIGKTRVINLGSEYKFLRYIILETNSQETGIEELSVAIIE